MSSEFLDNINEIKENVNLEILTTTIVFMIISFIYFIYRLKNLAPKINNELNNNQNNGNNNINTNNQNEKLFHIIIQIERSRYKFDIKINDNIGRFVREKIYPLSNNREVYLFYQGQLLNQKEKFSFYEHRLSDNMVILCQIRQNVSKRNLNINHYNDSMEDIEKEQLRNDPRTVSIYSIFAHMFIIFILGFIIFSNKTFSEIFTKQIVRIVEIFCIIWAISFSNTITKLIYFKKISY